MTDERVENIFSVVDALVEANEVVIKSLQDTGRYDDFFSVIDEMRQLGEWLSDELLKENDKITVIASSYCKNMSSAIQRISDENKKSLVYYKCNVASCIAELKRLVNLKYNVMINDESIKQYREKLMSDLQEARKNIETQENDYKYKVSIILCAYNKSEYTKLAAESIYRFTDFSKGDVELITIDNGSSDGTREYFRSLPNEKKIEYDYNIFGTRGAGFVAEGKYFVLFSNDVIATPHWLDQLLYVMECNPDAAMIVPTCNEESITRYQGVETDYENSVENIEKAIEFATKYNKRNSKLWEERSLLMPFVAMLPAKLYKYDLIDVTYTEAEFVDDDYSTTFRRAGWKMILAKDTFLHHFGGVTLNEARIASENNSLVNMRKVYYEKWGVDAWDSICEVPGIEQAFNVYQIKNNDRILVVEPRFGDQFLSIKNSYRRDGLSIGETSAIVADKRYLSDAIPMFDKVISEYSIDESIKTLSSSFDLIAVGVPLNLLPVDEYISFIKSLHEKLTNEGVLIVHIINYACGYYVGELLRGVGLQGEYVKDQDMCTPVKVLPIEKLINGVSRIKQLKKYYVHSLFDPRDAELNNRLTKFALDFTSTFDVETAQRMFRARYIYLILVKE